MSLLFNMLSRLVIIFLPRNKRLLISWLQSPSAVIFEPKKIKSVTVSIVSTSICHEVMGPDKLLGPTADFPTWGSGKGTENSQGICMFISPSNSYFEILIPTENGIRRWGLWEVLSSCGGALVNGISVLIKEAPANFLAPSTRWRHRENLEPEPGQLGT